MQSSVDGHRLLGSRISVGMRPEHPGSGKKFADPECAHALGGDSWPGQPHRSWGALKLL